MISVISLISNEKISKDFLLQGLSHQNIKYELILMDNKNNLSYKSASQAYNCGGIKAKGDYLMFIHQDVMLPSHSWLKDAENNLSTVSNLGIAGVAGMLKPHYIIDFEMYARYVLLTRLNLVSLWYKRYGRGNVFQGYEKKRWLGKEISEILSVQTLDELLLIVPSQVFEHIKFDETTCDSWHLYGVDYSLTASEAGLKTCVLPYPVVHLSSGAFVKPYLKTLIKLVKKHRNEEIINTTCGLWLTRPKIAELQMRFVARKMKSSFW
jgi:hypothetical protein